MPHETPDTNQPATDPQPQEASDQPSEPEQTSATAVDTPPVVDDAEADDDADGADDADPRTLDWYDGEVKRLRRQSKRYRQERNHLKQQLDGLHASATPSTQPDPVAEATQRAERAEQRLRRLELASTVGLPTGLLNDMDALASASTDEQLRDVMERIKSHLAVASNVRNPTPPEQPSTPPSLDAQIQAAEAAGNITLAMRLKTQKLHQQR